MNTPENQPQPSATDQSEASLPAPRKAPSMEILQSLVLEAVMDMAASYEDGEPVVDVIPSGSSSVLTAELDNGFPLRVLAESVDSEHFRLRFSFLAGTFVGDVASQAAIVGTLLDSTPFHIRPDLLLMQSGHLTVSCDLIVCDDDEPLVLRTLAETTQLMKDLLWYFPLRLPTRIPRCVIRDFEIPWDELPLDSLDEFLDAGMAAPPAERTPVALVWLALGFARWKDVLRLLREHSLELGLPHYSQLKVLALRELEAWEAAVHAGREAGVVDGRYPDGPVISPSFTHALIEAGYGDEALGFLGEPVHGEPAYHGWLRGIALHHTGEPDEADQAFTRYFRQWPGDVIGGVVTGRAVGAD